MQAEQRCFLVALLFLSAVEEACNDDGFEREPFDCRSPVWRPTLLRKKALSFLAAAYMSTCFELCFGVV